MEPKLLPSSMRESKRYIIFEVITENPINYNELINSIWNSIMSFLGELQSSYADIWLIQNLYDSKTQKGIIKCKTNFVEELRICLSSIQYVGETKSIIKILGVTGTIKSAKNKYISNDLRKFAGNNKGD